VLPLEHNVWFWLFNEVSLSLSLDWLLLNTRRFLSRIIDNIIRTGEALRSVQLVHAAAA